MSKSIEWESTSVSTTKVYWDQGWDTSVISHFTLLHFRVCFVHYIMHCLYSLKFYTLFFHLFFFNFNYSQIKNYFKKKSFAKPASTSQEIPNFLSKYQIVQATKHSELKIKAIIISPSTTLTPSLYLRTSHEIPSSWWGLRVALRPSSSAWNGGASPSRSSSSSTILATAWSLCW